MSCILCLWFPNWPVQRLLRGRPELKGQPVALVASGPRGGIVAKCSSAATAEGVFPGQPVAEAQALVRNLTVAPHQPIVDRRGLAKLAEACERFSPRVALEEGDEPESLLLDITNVTHLWGSEAKLVAQAEALFVRRGYRVRTAAAETIGQAWALAHFREERSKSDKETRRQGDKEREIATSSSPCLLLSLSPCRSSLPMEALRLPPDIITLLRQLGIETIGQLLALPRDALVSRFGEELLVRLDQFTGAAPEVIIPHRGRAVPEASCSLEESTADRATLFHFLTQLVDQLIRQLKDHDQGAVLLACNLVHSGGQTTPLRIGLMEPTANLQQLMELVGLHLETVKLPDEVIRVEVRIATAGRLGERQGKLFDDRWPSDPHQLAVLVNRLASRLGHEQVTRAELHRSPVPERAVRWVPLTHRKECERGRMGEGKKKFLRSLAHLPLSPSPCLPLLLYPQPRPIEVVCVAPDGPPQAVWLEYRRERITHHAGPERIETLWWRGRSVRRDYYRVATEGGNHLWLFRRLADANWFLHGHFA